MLGPLFLFLLPPPVELFAILSIKHVTHALQRKLFTFHGNGKEQTASQGETGKCWVRIDSEVGLFSRLQKLSQTHFAKVKQIIQQCNTMLVVVVMMLGADPYNSVTTACGDLLMFDARSRFVEVQTSG